MQGKRHEAKGEEREVEALRSRIKELEAEVERLRAGSSSSPAAAHILAALSSLNLMDTIEDGFVVLDSEWRFTYANRNAELLLRTNAGDLLGKGLWDVFPALAGLATEQALRNAMAHRVPGASEDYFEPLGRWFQGRYFPAPDGGLFVFFSNITERKMAEAALRRSEERWRTLADAIPQFIWVARTFGDTQFINNYWYEYTGLPKGDLRPESWSNVLHPEDLPRIGAMWQEAAAAGAERSFEYRVRRASDGAWRWHLGFHRPERDSSGAIVRWIGAGVDIHDLKTAQEALRETEERQRLALAAAGAGLWDWDVVHDRIVWSDQVYHFHGVEPGEFEGTRAAFAKFIHPDDLERVRNAIRTALTQGDSCAGEFRIIRPDGQIRWLSTNARIIRDDCGRGIRMLGATTDVTDRKAVEEAVANSERIYRAIGESLPFGIWICEPDGRQRYASDHILKLVGKTQEECRGYGWITAVHPEDAARVRSEWEQCVRTEALWDIEFRYRGADGLDYPVLVRGVPVRDREGRIVCWAGINLDVRRLKETEAALAAKVAEFEALFRALPVGVGVARDPGCEVVRINPALAELLGIPPEENASKSRPDASALPFRVLKDGREIPTEDLAMQVAARTGREVRDLNYELVRNDGVKIIEYAHAAPLFDSTGTPSGSIGVFLNITELKHAQQELERANAELRRVNEDLNQFAFAASHDLQELLRDLLAYVQIAAAADDEAGRADLNAVLHNVQANLASAIAESETVIESDPLPTVAGHAVHFAHLLRNLIGNAIRYRGESRPHIRLSARQSADFWQISVADNGIGIAENEQKRIFGVFQRLHGKDVPGTGIGLAICQRVVERYGGRIWVESKPGAGSTFHFTIPVSGEPAYRSAAAGTPSA